jgi:Bacterial Ig domain
MSNRHYTSTSHITTGHTSTTGSRVSAKSTARSAALVLVTSALAFGSIGPAAQAGPAVSITKVGAATDLAQPPVMSTIPKSTVVVAVAKPSIGVSVNDAVKQPVAPVPSVSPVVVAKPGVSVNDAIQQPAVPVTPVVTKPGVSVNVSVSDAVKAPINVTDIVKPAQPVDENGFPKQPTKEAANVGPKPGMIDMVLKPKVDLSDVVVPINPIPTDFGYTVSGPTSVTVNVGETKRLRDLFSISGGPASSNILASVTVATAGGATLPSTNPRSVTFSSPDKSALLNTEIRFTGYSWVSIQVGSTARNVEVSVNPTSPTTPTGTGTSTGTGTGSSAGTGTGTSTDSGAATAPGGSTGAGPATGGVATTPGSTSTPRAPGGGATETDSPAPAITDDPFAIFDSPVQFVPVTPNRPVTKPGTGTPALTFTPAEKKLLSQPIEAAGIPTEVRSDNANHAPMAANMTGTFRKNTAGVVTLVGLDPDGTEIKFFITELPKHGTLTGVAPTVKYTPAKGYTGADTFTYITNDGQLNSKPAMVVLSISANGKNKVAKVAKAMKKTKRVRK